VELVKVEDDWLWHSDMIDNRPEVGLWCFDRLATGEAKGRMENIIGGGEPITWCG
jgi:hypothetical protein